jgi:hypothetical protein
MVIVRDKQTEQLLFAKFREHLGRHERTGVHVSDLLNPLIAYWKRKKPLPLTDDECLYFLGGIAHHTMVEAALDTKEQSFLDEESGVTYSPDLYELRGEIKTTRSEKIPESEEEAKRKFADYIKQCRMYATLMGVNTYKLIINYHAVTERVSQFYTSRKPRMRVYTLTFTANELLKERARINSLSESFRQALVTDNLSSLPLCAAWKCYEVVEGKKIGKCQWWEDCKPKGRYDNGTENNLDD